MLIHAFYYFRIKNNPSLIRKIPPRLRNDIDSFIHFWEIYTPLSTVGRIIGCIGSACFRGAGAGANSNNSTRRRKSKKTRKSRKAPQIR
jgi:hypothetical protein